MKFDLKEAFEYRGVKYTELAPRSPKVRDMRNFMRLVEKDAVKAYEIIIANLCEIDEAAIGEMGIADFAVIKKWFEDFLKPMANDSEA